MRHRKLTNKDKQYLKKLGKKIEKIIIEERSFPSLDRFALEHYDHISKPSLYSLAKGERDFQFTTISGLARALNMKIYDLLKID